MTKKISNYEKIKNMSRKELANFLIFQAEKEEFDFDWEDNPISYVVTTWYTPFRVFPHYFCKEEVVEEVYKWLGNT